MGDKEDRLQDYRLNELIEAGELCPSCGKQLKPPYNGVPTECSDCYDPTPWCHQCGAIHPKQCDCGLIAENN